VNVQVLYFTEIGRSEERFHKYFLGVTTNIIIEKAQEFLHESEDTAFLIPKIQAAANSSTSIVRSTGDEVAVL
jgi:hypothetical protein